MACEMTAGSLAVGAALGSIPVAGWRMRRRNSNVAVAGDAHHWAKRSDEKNGQLERNAQRRRAGVQSDHGEVL